MTQVLATQNLTKNYDGNTVLHDVDWTVEPGQAWALLGTNGAGKSTLLKLLTGLILPSSGTVRVFGDDPITMPGPTRARLGYVAELPVLPGWARVGELIAFHASHYPRWSAERAADLLAALALPEKARIATLSKGQNRRLMLLLTLAQGSELVLLDEPGSGLDVAARRELLGRLGDFLADEDRSFVLSSHIVTDVERIASHVAILSAGRLVEATPLDELKEQVRRVRMPRALWQSNAHDWHRAGVLEVTESSTAIAATIRDFDAVPIGLRDHQSVDARPLGLEEIFLAIHANASNQPLDVRTDDAAQGAPAIPAEAEA